MAGDERRSQILRVAVDLFSHEGFRGTTTKKIAQAAGVSEAMVFRHFATKEELYAAILDHKACSGDAVDLELMVADAVKRRDDRAVFEGLAFNALEHHEGSRFNAAAAAPSRDMNWRKCFLRSWRRLDS